MTVHRTNRPFEVLATDCAARVGQLRLPRGDVDTPAFMPVGTQASVKSLDPVDIRETGSQIVLANTYHLMLRPGADIIAGFGGVSRFMRWNGPVLTDSGGFQVFSLSNRRKLSEDGVEFQSHLDGSRHVLTPRRAIELQFALGSDISMPLDVCAGFASSDDEQLRAMMLTHRWLTENVSAFRELHLHDGDDCPRSLLFGICQGGFDVDRRIESARLIADAECDGCAIGGLSVGEPKDIMREMLDASIQQLPAEQPRYLMGVGSPEDLWNAVSSGVDMFDCVLPTRVARRGAVFTADGRVNLTASRFLTLDEPIEMNCDCRTCTTYPIGYLCHLFRSKELLAYRLASIHNVRFIQRQMEEMRSAIRDRRFDAARAAFLRRYRPADQAVAAAQRAKFRARRDSVERTPAT
jgi:queuine tRNA-ribosyltransferase